MEWYSLLLREKEKHSTPTIDQKFILSAVTSTLNVESTLLNIKAWMSLY